MKLWSSVMTGGLPKCKRRAPKSQSLSKPFHPMLYPDFWDFFSQCLFQLVAQMKKSDSRALQLVMRTWCTEGSHPCGVPGSPCSPRSTRNCQGELTHHQAPALIPPDCLTSLPQHFFKAFLRLSEALAASKGEERVKGYLRDRTDSKPQPSGDAFSLVPMRHRNICILLRGSLVLSKGSLQWFLK